MLCDQSSACRPKPAWWLWPHQQCCLYTKRALPQTTVRLTFSSSGWPRKVKGKGFPYTSVLPLLSTRPAVTSPATEHHRPLAGTKLYCLVTEAHRCEQLDQGCYAALPQVGFELATYWSQVQRTTHCATVPPCKINISLTSGWLCTRYKCKCCIVLCVFVLIHWVKFWHLNRHKRDHFGDAFPCQSLR